jgi:hypothetical protein
MQVAVRCRLFRERGETVYVPEAFMQPVAWVNTVDVLVASYHV